jgi:hypothetical protein
MIKLTTKSDGSFLVRFCWLSVLPIACSITSDGIAVSIAFNTADDSIAGEINVNSFRCTDFALVYLGSAPILPPLALNREVLEVEQLLKT